MALNQHIGLRRETAWGTWNAPNVFIPFTSFEPDAGWESIEPAVTGSGRALRTRIRGAKTPAASLALPFWYERMGWLLIAMGLYDVATTTPGGATLARLHGFLPNNAQNPASLSFQAQYNASNAINMKGGVITAATITVTNKGTIDFAGDLLGEDMALAGGNWTDGTSSPAVIGSVSYFGGAINPFTAFDVSVSIGGTPTLNDTTNVISVSGGTPNVTLEALELSIENNGSVQHLLNQRRNPGSVWLGSRRTSLTMDVDWSTPDMTFYNYLESGTTFPVVITVTAAANSIETSFAHQLQIVMPRCAVNMGNPPAVQGSLDRPSQSVELVAMELDTVGADLNIILQDTTTSYAAA